MIMYDFSSPNLQHLAQQRVNERLCVPPSRPADQPQYNPLLPERAPPEPGFRPSRRLGLAPTKDPNDGFGGMQNRLAPGVFALSGQSSFRVGEDQEPTQKRSKRALPPPAPASRPSGKRRVPQTPSVPVSLTATPEPKSPWRPSPMTLITDLRNSEFRSEFGLPCKSVKHTQSHVFDGSPKDDSRIERKRLVPTRSETVGKVMSGDWSQCRTAVPQPKAVETKHEYIANQHFAQVYKSRTYSSQVLFHASG